MPLIAASISMFVGDVLDIVGADALEHFAEQIELAIGVGEFDLRFGGVSARGPGRKRTRRPESPPPK